MKADCAISLVNDEAWILYEDGYIEFSRFDEVGSQAERLSHYVHWETEAYPQNEFAIANLLAEIIDGLPPL